MTNKQTMLTTEQAYRAAFYLMSSLSCGSKKWGLPPLQDECLGGVMSLIGWFATGRPDGAYTADLWKDAIEKALSEPAEVENV